MFVVRLLFPPLVMKHLLYSKPCLVNPAMVNCYNWDKLFNRSVLFAMAHS